MKNPFRAFSARSTLQRAINTSIRQALRGSAGMLPFAMPTASKVPAWPGRGPGTPGPAPTGRAVERHRFAHADGSRAYQLYRPAHPQPRPMLLVMLHGCTQSAEDFALGTGMNRLAEEHGFLVVYPEQSAQANRSGCWNWFRPGDQQRGAGEPALIAGIVNEVIERHGVEARSVFVAGMSAGAAMALVMGETYPELFAAVGVHSGLPYGSAHDLGSALAAMKGGRARGASAGTAGRRAQQALPLIVFQGDRDRTVHAGNASAILEQAREAYARRNGGGALLASRHSAQASGGRRFTRTVWAPDGGPPHIEAWLLHGAGHKWSGGDARGSYTDAKGPDASAEMLRFFKAVVARR